MINKAPSSREQKILDRHRKLKVEKDPWLYTWQLVGEYVMTRKQEFTGKLSPGQFLTGKIFDGTAESANHLLASSLIGALWTNGAKTFRIEPPDSMADLVKTAEVKKYYERITKEMAAAIDNPKAGFRTSLEEYMLDQGAFGISGISAFENPTNDPSELYDMPVVFGAVDAKAISIDENSRGFVDTCYIEREITVRQLVQEYGLDNVSKKSREAFENERGDEKVMVLHAIEPRLDAKYGGFGNADMPVASIHIEIAEKHILKESGYHEMPVFITRFYKAMGEKYGRSPGMGAMSDILEANALREASIIATEKMLDPPLLVEEDGIAGGGTIDTSAGAITVKHSTGRMGGNDKVVEPLVTVGEINTTFNRIKELVEIISRHFFIDRLLDLNNEQRMTLGEANIRNELRGQSLNTIYARQIAELFTPIIERVFNIMFALGMLGVVAGSDEEAHMLELGIEPIIIPEAVVKLMAQGKNAYKVTFISPAARIMQAEELSGIQQTVEFAISVAAVVPDILDNIDFDRVIRRVNELTGGASDIMRSMDEVAKIRQQREQQQAQMMQMQAEQVAAETAKKSAQAAQAASKAGIAA